MTARTVVRRTKPAGAEAPADFGLSEAGVADLSARLGEPDWLRDRRLQAWRDFESLSMPATTDEAWRRTDLRGLPLERISYGAASETPAPGDLLQPLAGDAHGALLVLRPGQAADRQGGEELAGRGVVFTDWADAVRNHAEILRMHMGAAVKDDEGKFSALAAAGAGDGTLLYVPAGVQVESPLHSILWAPGEGRLFTSRLLIVVEAGASATYVHESASPSERSGAAMHAGIVEILVGAGAKLTFVELQNWGTHVWNFTHERARLQRDGNLDWIFGAVGSRLTKNFSELDLKGMGSQGRMSGFYFADGSQHLDHDTQQNHLAEHTTSDLLYKGALLGKSRSVWQGMIYVAPGAQKADGYQANRNLVLSTGARADSIPGLEILADDVRCTHGATVGQLEEEPVFYLMSRGIPRHEAERIVVDGFFDPIMQRIPFEGVRERFKRMISEKMA